MRKWNIKWHLKAGLLAALLAISTAAHAGPFCSVKALGMGGAATAYGQDSLTAFFNPATAGEVESRWDLEFETAWNSKKLTIGDRRAGIQTGTFQNENRWDFYGSGGINYRFGCQDEWAAGVQWNNIDQIKTHYRNTIVDFSAATGQSPRFNYRLDALTFTGAYNFDCHNTFGVGLNVYFSWLSTRGLASIADPDLSINPGNVTNRGTDEATGVGATFGYLGHWDDLSVGFAYSTRAHMSDFKKYNGLVAGGHIAVPDVFRVGVAYDADCATTVVMDYEYHRWSRANAWNNDFNLAAGVTRFGDSNGPGFGWRDQSIVKLGIDFHCDPCMTARLGYRWEQIPFRNNAGTRAGLNALTVNTVQNYLTAGVTYNWDACSELSWFGEYGFNGTAKARFPDIDAGATWQGANLHFKAQRFSTGIAYGASF